ncbi:MAG TPA: hypothetical protein ENK77_03045 [Epsilonproteobacteria bacterium]|nr:hypothetical protein [Campylobacterota bacterium]HHH37574.1 hypothetical protein [Campylobacterota bacterium]
MKKKSFIATLAALGLAASVYAGNGMGCGGCGQQGMGMMNEKGMKHHRMQMSAEDTVHCRGMHRMKGYEMRGTEGSMQGRGMHGQKMKHNGMIKQLMSQLDLSDTQKEKIREIKRESRQAMKQRNRKPEMDFGQFMSKDRFDKEAFKKTMQQKWEARDKIRQAKREIRLTMMSDRMAKIFDVLTPEQREKLIELKK